MKTFRNILGSAAATLVLAACVTTNPSWKTGYRAVDADNAQLVFASDTYKETAPQRVLFASPLEREEYALYRSKDGAQAEIIYVSLRRDNLPNIALEYASTIANMVETFNAHRGGGLKFEEPVWYDADWGVGYWYRVFQDASGRACVGFQADWDSHPEDVEHRPGRVIMGYHCQAPGMSLDLDGAEAVIAGIGLKGISIKSRDGTPEVIAVADARRQTQLAALVKGSSGTGNPNFPYQRAVTFHNEGDEWD